MRLVTYYKNANKILYVIRALEKTLSTTWYYYEKKIGKLIMSWNKFITFLLNDLFLLEIRLCDLHKKY